MNMRKTVYVVALLFVLAIVAQWAVMAATTTAPTSKHVSKPAPTHKTVKTPTKVTKTPAKKGAGPMVQEVSVKLTESGLMLSPSTVNAGKVRFVVRNSAKSAVPFEIKGTRFDQKISEIRPGQQKQMTLDLKRGKYEVYATGRALKMKGAHATLDVK